MNTPSYDAHLLQPKRSSRRSADQSKKPARDDRGVIIVVSAMQSLLWLFLAIRATRSSFIGMSLIARPDFSLHSFFFFMHSVC